MGIKAAEKFPADFDGIVAGAPAVNFNNLISWRASFFPITGAIGTANFISADTWKTTIHNEVLARNYPLPLELYGAPKTHQSSRMRYDRRCARRYH
jgi:hypothetical protein